MQVASLMFEHRPATWVFLGLIALGAGCVEELGPQREATTAIQGRVRVRGQVVGSGWIEFMPVDGTRGRLRVAPLGVDGTFRVEKVAIGPAGIRVITSQPYRTGDARLDGVLENLSRAYAIRRNVMAGAGKPLEIDLAVEAARLTAGS